MNKKQIQILEQISKKYNISLIDALTKTTNIERNIWQEQNYKEYKEFKYLAMGKLIAELKGKTTTTTPELEDILKKTYPKIKKAKKIITQIKNAITNQEDITKYLNQLEKIVDKQTNTIIANETSKEKRTNISRSFYHDLKSPLATTKSIIYLMQENPTTEEIKEYMQGLDETTNYQERLIRNAEKQLQYGT